MKIPHKNPLKNRVYHVPVRDIYTFYLVQWFPPSLFIRFNRIQYMVAQENGKNIERYEIFGSAKTYNTYAYYVHIIYNENKNGYEWHYAIYGEFERFVLGLGEGISYIHRIHYIIGRGSYVVYLVNVGLRSSNIIYIIFIVEEINSAYYYI